MTLECNVAKFALRQYFFKEKEKKDRISETYYKHDVGMYMY